MKVNNTYALDMFIDPTTRESLTWDAEVEMLMTVDGGYSAKNRVVDFYEKIMQRIDAGDLKNDQSPELRSAHDAAFAQNEETGGNIYGALESLPAITQSGHYRRMEILAGIDLGDIAKKTVVDFGTGSWGFGAIFPKLREARLCIGFDVSLTALQMAKSATNDELVAKTIYATSEGEIIPLADDTVDIFFGGEVIEHVRSPLQFVQEVARICKHDAIVILTTPNRDAIFYRINNLHYCVGPEHIALMSHDEFHGLLEIFTDNIRMIGYETSLGPGLDSLFLDPKTCGLIQNRSASFPELSTGLISSSTVNKEKFKKNRFDLVLRETIWSNGSVAYKYPFESLVLFDNVQGALLQAGNQATIKVCATDISLLFWGHDWSGFVEIICGENTVQQDLYSPGGGFVRVNVNNSAMSGFLTVRCLEKKRDASNSDQVIFYKVIEYIEMGTRG